MNGNLFTPRMSAVNNERYNLQISDDDHAKIIRGQNWEAVVTDIVTGVEYQARGAECSAGPRCFCDAIASPVVEQRTETIYSTLVWLNVNLDGAETGEEIAEAVEGAATDFNRALTLLRTPGVVLADTLWDKRDGYSLVFETTDEGLAREHVFDEMLRLGEEDDEPTPWTANS
jgi:hypothetical protein